MAGKIDPAWCAANVAWIKDYDSPVKAVQAAYNAAAQTVQAHGKTPVYIEVHIRVAPETNNG